MIRLLNAYFPARTLFLSVSEAVEVTMSFVIATVIWLGALNASIVLSYEQGFTQIAVLTGLFMLCLYYFDLYDPLVLGNRREIFTRLIQVLGAVFLLLALIYAIFPSMHMAPSIFLTGSALVTVALPSSRRIFLALNTVDALAEKCLLLGEGPLAETLIAELGERRELGIRVVGQLSREQWNSEQRTRTFEDELEQIVRQQRVSRVIVAMGERRGALPVELLLQIKTQGVRIQDGTELYEAISGKINPASLRLSWLLFSPGFQVSRALLVYKRVFSMLASFACVLLALPLMLVIALAIRLDSPGPVIFRQRRVGKDGKTFTLFKFRSMFQNADQDGDCKPAVDNDRRVTRVGRWLRASRLDELPQLFNILRGDLYFVGPRPFVPNQEDECARSIPFYSQRWSVKPGATGWAQVNRGYCVTMEDNAEKLAYDLFYIKNMSVGLDLLILFKTVKILLLGRGGQ